MAGILPGQNWTVAEAAHLLNRAGFGGSPDEIARLHALGRAGAVQMLLAGDNDNDLFPVPSLTQPAEHFAFVQAIRQAKDPERQETVRREKQQQRREMTSLRGWWLERMRYSPDPLREKMALFWHGHFATSFEKVRYAYAMWQQNETFRAHGMGNFRRLTEEVSRDPAMMRYLDLQQSERAKPNENFSRELMELFTLGEGMKYTEKDVKESARAFTGYRINPSTSQFLFARRQFDDTDKVFMMRRGNFSGDDVINIICDQPECAAFISEKIWVHFAGSAPSPLLKQRLAASFRTSDYDIKTLLKTVFLSPEFYSADVMNQQVKSPVQWLVQTSRTLEAPLPPAAMSEASLRLMGQNLFEPPNVKGWEGGRAWINASTFLQRCNLAGEFLHGDNSKVDGNVGLKALNVPWDKVAPPNIRGDSVALCEALAFRFYNAPLRPEERKKFVAFLEERGPVASEATIRDLVHLMMSTPDYQLT